MVFNQFSTTDIIHNEAKINIDKDGFSGRYTGISQKYSEFGMDTTDILTGSTRTLINVTQTSVPVYEEKLPQPEAPTPLYTTDRKIVGYIKPYDFYIRYQVAHPHQDNVHRVMFNDGTDVELGYITEKLEFPSESLGVDNNEVIEAPKLNGHDLYTCVEYVQLQIVINFIVIMT